MSADWYPYKEEIPTVHLRWLLPFSNPDLKVLQQLWRVREGDVWREEWREIPMINRIDT